MVFQFDGLENAPELGPRFAAVYTAAIADVLDDLGHRTQTLPARITALTPGMRVAGPAFTVEGRTNDGMPREASMRRILEMLGEIPRRHVAVYGAGDNTCAHFGELSATSLVARGCAGVVIDGGCRDVDLVTATGLPVFATYRTPQDAVTRWEIVGWGHDISIDGVVVRSADYMVGDADGVVVIPAEIVEDVLTRAEAVVSTESEVREAVRDGMPPLQAYDKYGKF